MSLIEFEESNEYSAALKVVGVGGGGTNAVNSMVRNQIMGVEFIVANTDIQSLESSSCTHTYTHVHTQPHSHAATQSQQMRPGHRVQKDTTTTHLLEAATMQEHHHRPRLVGPGCVWREHIKPQTVLGLRGRAIPGREVVRLDAPRSICGQLATSRG